VRLATAADGKSAVARAGAGLRQGKYRIRPRSDCIKGCASDREHLSFAEWLSVNPDHACMGQRRNPPSFFVSLAEYGVVCGVCCVLCVLWVLCVVKKYGVYFFFFWAVRLATDEFEQVGHGVQVEKIGWFLMVYP